MADIPQPHRNVDLIMQAFGGLGGLGKAFADEQSANAPVHPALQKYLERLLAGEDPTKLASEAKMDPDWQRMEEFMRGRRQPMNAAGYVPDVGFNKGMPAVMSPGTVNPAGGPEGAVRGLGSMQQGALTGPPAPQSFSGNYSASLTGAPQQRPGMSLMGQPPAPPSLGDQSPDAAAMTNMTHNAAKELGGSPPPVNPALQETPPIAPAPAQAPQQLPEPEPYTESAPPQAAPPRQAFGQGMTAAKPPPAPLPQAGQPQGQRQPFGQGMTTLPKPQGQQPTRPFTNRDMASIQQMLPAIVAATSRENVARTKAQADLQATSMKQKVRAMMGMMREQGLDIRSAETMFKFMEGQDSTNQIAAMNLIGKLLMNQADNEARRAGSGDKLNAELGKRISALDQRLARNMQALSVNPGNAKLVESITAMNNAIERERAALLKTWSQRQSAPLSRGLPTRGPTGEAPSPDGVKPPAESPNGVPYSYFEYDQNTNETVYKAENGEPVDVVPGPPPTEAPVEQ